MMNQMFDTAIAKQIEGMLQPINKDVTIVLFTSEKPCQTCPETEQLLTEFVAFNTHLHLVRHTREKDADLAKQYGIERVPGFLLLDAQGHDRGIRFSGIPAGHEINSLISAVLDLGTEHLQIDPVIKKRIEAINKPVDIKVFVTLGCPHCPGAVHKAHQLAMLNPNIRAEMVEAQTFMELSNQFRVSGVPKIVFNDQEKQSMLGNQPLEAFLSQIDQL